MRGLLEGGGGGWVGGPRKRVGTRYRRAPPPPPPPQSVGFARVSLRRYYNIRVRRIRCRQTFSPTLYADPLPRPTAPTATCRSVHRDSCRPESPRPPLTSSPGRRLRQRHRRTPFLVGKTYSLTFSEILPPPPPTRRSPRVTFTPSHTDPEPFTGNRNSDIFPSTSLPPSSDLRRFEQQRLIGAYFTRFHTQDKRKPPPRVNFFVDGIVNPSGPRYILAFTTMLD